MGQKVTLVKKLKYKDGEDGDDDCPREFAELPGNPDCFDAEMPQKARPPPESETKPEPLIEDMSKASRKPALKKGFLNSSKAKAELYQKTQVIQWDGYRRNYETPAKSSTLIRLSTKR